MNNIVKNPFSRMKLEKTQSEKSIVSIGDKKPPKNFEELLESLGKQIQII